MLERRHRLDTGGLVFGVILLLVGGYFLLRNTLGLEIPEIDWDLVWPLILVALGAAVVYRAWARRPPA